MTTGQLNKIVELLREAQTVLLFPHVQIDGDAFGSSLALCGALRNQGKQVYVLMEEGIPHNLSFLCGEFYEEDCRKYCVEQIELEQAPDLCLAIDCSDRSRLESRTEVFFRGKNTACVDHHVTHEPFADYSYVDTGAAATGEIVYDLLQLLEIEIDKMTAEAIYVAIATDTGNFQYSNTRKETHLAIAGLFDRGINHNAISVNLYQNIRPEKVKLTGIALARMEFFCDGKACITMLSQEDFQKSGAFFSESEGIVEQLRNIQGVEIAIVLKEDQGKVKVGMRSKQEANVAKISTGFGGGGHERAAGCTIAGTLLEARAKIKEAASEELLRISQK